MPFTNLGRHRAPGWMTSTTSRRTPVRLTLLGVMTALGVMVLATGWAGADDHISDNGVVPVFVAGNPTCVGLGYDFGYKVDPPNSGTYSIDGINTVTVTTDGVYFDWESTLGMDA